MITTLYILATLEFLSPLKYSLKALSEVSVLLQLNTALNEENAMIPLKVIQAKAKENEEAIDAKSVWYSSDIKQITQNWETSIMVLM